MDGSSWKTSVYEALQASVSTSQTRLVRLHPGRGDESIRCELRTQDLKNKCPSYEALSYCWGNANVRTSIECNGVCAQVTVSLAAALRHLRYENDDRTLWVDAICINQDDIEERNQQVSMMRDIYQNAHQTIIWLGEESADSGLAISACEQLLVAIFKDDAGQSFLANFHRQRKENPFRVRFEDSEVPGMPERKDIIAISRLLKRSWFRRIWVIQEVGSSSTVLMMCGDKVVDFDIFWCGFLVAFLISKYRRAFGQEDFWQLYLFILARNRNSCDPRVFELLELLMRTRTFQATDPRDKAFALYGLVTIDLSSMDLKVDYKLSTAETYKQITLAILRCTHDLEILETPRSTTELRNSMPSWVTDWSDASSLPSSITNSYGKSQTEMKISPAVRNALVSRLSVLTGLPRHEPEGSDIDPSELPYPTSDLPRLFAAARNSKSMIKYQNDSDQLCLEGQAVDSIVHVCSVMEQPQITEQEARKEIVNLSELEAKEQIASVRADAATLGNHLSSVAYYFKTVLEWEDMALQMAELKYPTGESQLAAFWQTLCAGHYTCTYEEAEADFMSWRAMFKDIRRASRISRFIWGAESTFLTMLAAGVGKIFRSTSKRFQFFCDAMDHRRLARTARGYLALVPVETQTGDVVTILKGGRVPFVLRSKGDVWQLIGAAYVHGIMHGNAFDEEKCVPLKLV